ncbi:MAG: hypothetical protein GY940_05855 [bacterium]|nr:hypothetical protein [bacterium]
MNGVSDVSSHWRDYFKVLFGARRRRILVGGRRRLPEEISQFNMEVHTDQINLYTAIHSAFIDSLADIAHHIQNELEILFNDDDVTVIIAYNKVNSDGSTYVDPGDGDDQGEDGDDEGEDGLTGGGGSSESDDNLLLMILAVVGTLLFAMVIGVMFYARWRKKRNKKKKEKRNLEMMAMSKIGSTHHLATNWF